MSLVNRVQNILMKPATEWQVIANEPDSVGRLFTGYAAILALIPLAVGILVALVLGAFVSGFAGPGMGAVSTGALLVQQIIGYILGLVMLLGMCYIVNAISPSFNGKQDLVQASKLMVYAGTAVWVSSIALIIPILGFFVWIAGIAYSIYLIYLGANPVLSVPKEKVAGFTVVVFLIYLVLFIVVALLNSMVSGYGAAPSF